MGRADVIIIDDDQSWLGTVKELLQNAGYRVHAVCDAEQALDLLATRQPAMVISDVHMPRIDGLELVRQFRSHDRSTPVVMISADDQASLQDRAMAAGATAFLRKPISAPLLMRAVRRYVGDAEAGKSGD